MAPKQKQRRTDSPKKETKQNPRISKQDFWAISALWMERCPLGTKVDKPNLKAGAVFVGTNDRILAMDCTRNGVHAAARVLINFPDKAKGCTVYMSRKPCSYCVKLLVQAEVKKIVFLPFEPEVSPDPDCSKRDNAIRIENLLKVFPVGMSICKPEVGDDMIEGLASTVKRPDAHFSGCKTFKRKLLKTYWSDGWVNALKEIAEQAEIPSDELKQGETSQSTSSRLQRNQVAKVKTEKRANLRPSPRQRNRAASLSKKKQASLQRPSGDVEDFMRWPGLDVSFVKQLETNIPNLMTWIAKATVAVLPGGLDDPRKKSFTFKPFPKETETSNAGNNKGGDVSGPECGKELALHMSRMALIAARRTDDPSTGVGVILLVKDEVVSVGINGYPTKANVGDFPRSKDAKTHGTSLKYPYLIHAEQNALLLRNTRDIKDESTTAFVTKTPCDECVGLLVESGVRNVVLPWKEKRDKSKPGIKYEAFFKAIKDSKFRAFYADKVDSPDLKSVTKKLNFSKSSEPSSSGDKLLLRKRKREPKTQKLKLK